MKVAYIDTSMLVAVALEEGSDRWLSAMQTYDSLYSSILLEAELRGTFLRRRVNQSKCENPLSWVTWVLPQRPLRREILRALNEGGYQRGADLLHVATALFIADKPVHLPFLTLDRKQQRIAHHLGFPTPGYGAS